MRSSRYMSTPTIQAKSWRRPLTYGGLLTVKVENMRQQHTELLQQEGETAPRQSLPPEKKYGFVAVAAGGAWQRSFLIWAWTA